MSKTSSAQRTIRALKEQGRVCAVVEKYNPHVGAHGIRQDLFGIIDVLALDPVRGFIGVQCCTGSRAEHWRKMTEEKAQECRDWLMTPGGVLELWTWRKVKMFKGSKAEVWRPKIEEIKLENIGGK